MIYNICLPIYKIHNMTHDNMTRQIDGFKNKNISTNKAAK